MRGDNSAEIVWQTRATDSPPRAWGQPTRYFSSNSLARFTPTCVGTTPSPGRATRKDSIHPHVRGDNRGVSPDARGVPDSPPRAWGQPENTVIADYRSRFTPTCVGTTRVQMPCWVHPAIHPHVRGDNRNERRIRPIHLDSPPRAWGQLFREQRHRVRHRFTPTCVGTTSAKRQNRPAWSIHPHVRGDNSIALSLGSWVNDSPPRAWGQRSLPLRRARYLRFTPTCVGTTTPTGSATTRCTIHPHVRGDNYDGLTAAQVSADSPPRAWGQQGDREGRVRSVRFTPTCVGTTLPILFIIFQSPIHPHVRGDNAISEAKNV